MQNEESITQLPASSRSAAPGFELEHLREKELLSALVHKIGHEIGNPLTSIISLATVIERFLQPDAKSGAIDPLRLAAYSSSIINESWRISSTVEKVVLLFSQRAGSPSNCDIAKAVQLALNKLRTRQKADTSVVQLRLGGAGPASAFIDLDQFVSLLTELVDNAFQTPGCDARESAEGAETGGCEVLIETRPQGDWVEIAVHSWSPDPCPLDLSEAFEPLVTSRSDQKRVGLGLTTAYSIVSRAGGKIEVKEEPDAENGRFRFSTIVQLPSRDEGLSRRKAPEKAADIAETMLNLKEKGALPAALNVIIVEDEKMVCGAMSRILESCLPWIKIRCSAMSGAQAVSAISSGTPFDAMLCDLNLGQMSGRYVYETLMNERPDEAQKFVFITGDRGRPETQLYLESSGRRYLHKPFAAEELLELVAGIIEDLAKR